MFYSFDLAKVDQVHTLSFCGVSVRKRVPLNSKLDFEGPF